MSQCAMTRLQRGVLLGTVMVGCAITLSGAWGHFSNDDDVNERVSPVEVEVEAEAAVEAEAWTPPPARLASMPDIPFDSKPYAPTEVEQREIAELIEKLILIDKPDYGMAPAMSGSQFAPVASSRHFSGGIMVDHGLETSEGLTRLVALGPKALPQLLEAIDDATPSGLVMQHDSAMGAMWYGKEVGFNRANEREANIGKAAGLLHDEEVFRNFSDHIRKHVITRGDLCFLIIGQIVNRSYQPSRYQPTACQVINSPTHDPALAKVVRQVWTTQDAAQTLFESLMVDFHSRGGAAQFQTEAAMRLMYYFPEESRKLIADRLDALDVRRIRVAGDDWEPWRIQHETNGEIRPGDLVKAVAFADDPMVTQAILRIIERTDDAAVFHECLSSSVVKMKSDLIVERTESMMAAPPGEQMGPFGGEYHLLRAAAAFFPERARTSFETYLAHDTLNCRRACIHALNQQEKQIPWAVEFLTPLLSDTTDTGWQYGPDYDRNPIRVCDEAAQVLTAYVADAVFVYEGETTNLDRQIANIRRRIAGEPVEPEPPAAMLVDFDAVPVRDAVKAFVFGGRVQIYPFSDKQQLVCGTGYRADCWAYDTIVIDVESGSLASRVKLDEWKGGVSIIRPYVNEKAFCYNVNGDGLVVIRNIRTAAEMGRVATPFHDRPPIDALFVRNIGDAAVTEDGAWILAIGPDGTLHSIEVATGNHETPWKLENEDDRDGFMVSASLQPMQGTNRFIIDSIFIEGPLRIWDHDARSIQLFEKMPYGAWREAWGNYLLNNLNGFLVLWNLETRKPVPLPLPSGLLATQIKVLPSREMAVVEVTGGAVWIVDLRSLTPVMRLNVPATEGRTTLLPSTDGRFLFWQSDLSKYDRETGASSNQKTHMAIFQLDE